MFYTYIFIYTYLKQIILIILYVKFLYITIFIILLLIYNIHNVILIIYKNNEFMIRNEMKLNIIKIELNRCVPTVNEENIESLKPYLKGRLILDQDELKTIFDLSGFLENVCFYTLNYRYTYIK